MPNVIYINQATKQIELEAEFLALAAQIQDHNKCSAMKQLIIAAFTPYQPEAQQAL